MPGWNSATHICSFCIRFTVQQRQDWGHWVKTRLLLYHIMSGVKLNSKIYCSRLVDCRDCCMIYLLSELNGRIFKVNAVIPKISHHFAKCFRLILPHILKYWCVNQWLLTIGRTQHTAKPCFHLHSVTGYVQLGCIDLTFFLVAMCYLWPL